MDEALEKFIDSKIPKDLRENYARDVSMLKAGWNAALRHVEGLTTENTKDTENAT